eukprot:jgi/Hompol1/4322/HPOL_001576-RA
MSNEPERLRTLIEQSLDLEDIDPNLFRSKTLWKPVGNRAVFGGQVVGLALSAATQTVDPKFMVHSLHSYFLLPGDNTIPIIFRVYRNRDGKSYATRSVAARQRGRVIFILMCSFQVEEASPLVHQLSTESCLYSHEQRLREWLEDPRAAKYHKTIQMRLEQPIPIDSRPVSHKLINLDPKAPLQYIWMKAKGQLPENQAAFHRCVAAFCSDHELLNTSLIPHGLATGGSERKLSMVTSLDHSMWFHAPFRADEWLLYVMESPRSVGGRGYAHSRIYTQDGRLVVSTAQEARRSVNVFAEFAKSIRRQIDENKDFQKNVKLLSDESSKLAESDAIAKAKQAVSKTTETTTKVLNAVGSVVDKTLETPVVKATGEVIAKTAETVASVSQKVAEPIANTAAAKAITSSIKEVVDSSSNAFYAEYKPKDIREKERQERIEAIKRRNPLAAVSDPSRPVLPNPEAGGSVVMHKSSKMAESWRKFSEESAVGRTLFAARRSIEDSQNPVISRLRDLFSTSNVQETEHARVIRAFKQIDPMFSLDAFLKEATQYTLPDLLEAYFKGDAKLMKEWCSEAAYAKLSSFFESQKQQGLISDSKLLDIRGVDVRQLTMLEDEIPIILIGFTTQEILLFRNAKGVVVAGRDDRIETANYVVAFSKAQIVYPESEFNPATNGWMVVDWLRSGGRSW